MVDIFNPRLDILTRDSTKQYPVGSYFDPDIKRQIVITESNIYDASSQVNKLKWFYSINGNEEFVVDYKLRIIFPCELDMLLKYSGFSIEAKYGDYDESPFQAASPKQLVICRT